MGRRPTRLIRHLRDAGSYVGLEIDPAKVRYCVRTVGAVAENFSFRHVDAFSRYYNPDGRMRARDVTFPLESGRFDFVLLSSVFTHMLPEDVERYLQEISRVMAPEATLVCSFWLTRDPLGPPFVPYSDVSEIYNPDEPEHGVVLRESYVRRVVEDCGIQIERLTRGSKFGGDDPDHNRNAQQDILIGRKG